MSLSFHSRCEPTWELPSPHFTVEESDRLVKSPAKSGAWFRLGGRSAYRRLHMGAEAAAQLLLPALPPRGAPTFAGPSPAHRPLETTLPGRTRERARAPGPPPWRPCCPGRSNSRVRRRSLATTPPLQGLRRLGGKALGAKPVGAWP